MRTATTSSSCRCDSGSIATHHSSGVGALGSKHHPDRPADCPQTCCPPSMRFEAAFDQRPHRRAGDAAPLELADRIEVLRRPRVAADLGGEARQRAGGGVGECGPLRRARARPKLPVGRCRSSLRRSAAARRSAQYQEIAFESLLAEQEDRACGLPSELGEDRTPVGREVRARLPLDHADDRRR